MSTKLRIERLQADPARLHDLTPRDFEEVIAELLAATGWQVNITPQTRDGGYDILGIVRDSLGLQTSWIVECKKYRPEHKVGVETVRQLYGVKQYIGVPNAVLVTTSAFTKGAHDFSASRGDIRLVDFSVLAKWLEEYRALPTGDTHTESSSFESCFVSYSVKDELFVQKFVTALKARGIKTWYAPEDMRPGDKIFDQVKKAIGSFDRLIIVISKESLKSNWVGSEISMALRKEQEQKRRVLFPVSLIKFDDIREWCLFDEDTGLDIGKQIRSYHISDFSRWTVETEFTREVDKVANALSSGRFP